jgi:hypothetical protein
MFQRPLPGEMKLIVSKKLGKRRASPRTKKKLKEKID